MEESVLAVATQELVCRNIHISVIVANTRPGSSAVPTKSTIYMNYKLSAVEYGNRDHSQKLAFGTSSACTAGRHLNHYLSDRKQGGIQDVTIRGAMIYGHSKRNYMTEQRSIGHYYKVGWHDYRTNKIKETLHIMIKDDKKIQTSQAAKYVLIKVKRFDFF